MRRFGRSTVGSVIGVMLATATAVLSSPAAPSSAEACDLTWDGSAGGGDGSSWNDNQNWGGAGVPQAGDVVCIGMPDHVVVDAAVGDSHIAQLQLTGTAEVEVKNGAGLFVDGGVESVWAPGTNVAINNTGQIGGAGTIRVQGGVFFASPGTGSELTSGASGSGKMLVEGLALVVQNGLGLRSGYQVDVAAGGRMILDPGTWLAADPGTATTIRSGATLDIRGDGGYYRGAAGQPSVLTNNGTLKKSGGNGTSVVDASYQGAGAVQVQSGALALPDSGQVGAAIWPGSTLATGRCGAPVTSEICQPTQDPGQDPMSVALTVPSSGSVANGRIQELAPVATSIDADRIGNEVLAHIDNLATDNAHPARVSLRFSQADVMSTPLEQVQMVHTTDDNQQVLLPDCVNGGLPAGLWSCVVRPVTRDSQNTFVTVLTTQTSRWHARRHLPIENQGAPTAPRGVVVKEARPFDGSVLSVTWTRPSSDGAGPISAYRVYVDGKLRASPAGTSATLKNAGPGKHKVKVAAVNAAGTGRRAGDTITLAELSKPRRVEAERGKPGGPTTVTVSWKPPADAGGLVLKGYEVTVYRDGAKVDSQKVGAAERKLSLRLKPGSYEFRVRAKNADGWGPRSKATDLVRPR